MKRVCRRSYNHCMWEWRRWVRESGHPGLRYFLLHIVCRETSGRAAFQRIFSTVYIYFFYFLLRIVCREKNCRGALPRNFSFSILLFPYYFYFLVHIVCLETIGRAMFQRNFFCYFHLLFLLPTPNCLSWDKWASCVSGLGTTLNQRFPCKASFHSFQWWHKRLFCVGRFAYKRNLPPSLPSRLPLFLVCVSVPSNSRSLLQAM